MTPEDRAALLAPVERNYLRNPELVKCPECDGIGGFPAFDVDGSAVQATCPLCDGQCEVGREVWIDFMQDDA